MIPSDQSPVHRIDWTLHANVVDIHRISYLAKLPGPNQRLEVVIITGLPSFHDRVTGTIFASDSAAGTSMLTAGISLLSPLATFKANSDSHSSSNNWGITSPTVQYPGKSVAGLQMREKSQPNEILVTSLFDPNDSAEYAVEPLNDSNLLYAIIRSQTEEEVSKVVTITSLEKRVRYNGGAHEEELHQHV
ncbi:hypothetical protein FRB97_003822, partial [Tulasnella sp. 331]